MMKALIIYWLKTENTEKVAFAIKEGLEVYGVKVLINRTEEAKDINFFDYDLILIGFPVHRWSPPNQVDTFLRRKFSEYYQQGRVKTGAPKIPGKNVLIFCTYSGPHTGINEAIPAGKYAGQNGRYQGTAQRGRPEKSKARCETSLAECIDVTFNPIQE